MNLPDLLTETDFLVREFPMPGNPQRPLAVFAPDPADNARAVVRHVEEIARRGYGGMVLDPASFGALFLSETWLRLVELYVEACRLTGLFLWLLDGFTIGDAFPAWLDEHLPVWRGPEIVTRSIAVQGPERVELSLPGPAEGRCLGLLARDMDGTAPPINLLACSDGSRLRWDPPSGRWEVISFLACAAPRSNTFNWSDSDVVASWLQVGFEPYRSLFQAISAVPSRASSSDVRSGRPQNPAARRARGLWPGTSNPHGLN